VHYIHALIDFILHIDVHLNSLISTYGGWVYAFLFLIIFCETGLVVLPFLPGDSILFVAGALSASPHNILNVHLLALLMVLAAILGDTVNFLIGRFVGEKLFSNPGARLMHPKYLEKTHAFFEKHGGKSIIIARFVPIIRTLAPFVAGMGHMGYWHFIRYNVIGGIAWAALFVYAGFFFGDLPIVHRNINYLIIALIIVSLIPPFIEFARQRIHSNKK